MSPRSSAGTHKPSTPLSLRWDAPHGRFSLILLFGAVRTLESAAKTGSDSEVGLLLGRAGGTSVVFVSEVRLAARGSGSSLPSPPELSAAIEDFTASAKHDLDPVGVYIIDRGATQVIAPAALSALAALFGGPTPLFHIHAGPRTKPRCTAQLWVPGEQSLRRLGLEFALDQRELVDTFFDPFQPQMNDTEPARRPAPYLPPASRAEFQQNRTHVAWEPDSSLTGTRERASTAKWVGAFVALVVLTAALGWLATERGRGWLESDSPKVRDRWGDAAAPTSGRQADSNLVLDVKGEGANTQIRWDQKSAAIRNAAVGFLDIDEGGRRTRLQLSAEELQRGYVVYYTTTGDITITMNVVGPNGDHRSSVRFINPQQSGQGRSAYANTYSGNGSRPDRLWRDSADPGGAWQRVESPRVQPAPAARRTYVPSARGVGQVKPPSLEPAPTGILVPSGNAAGASITGALKPAGDLPPAPREEQVEAARVAQPSAPPTGQAVSSQAASSTPPKLIRKTEITLPPEARHLRSTHKLTLRLVVNAAGNVELVSDNASSAIEKMLARSAARTVRQWRFEPATLNGRPVPSEHVVHVMFGAPR